MLTVAAKRKLLSQLLNEITEAGWGTSGYPPSPTDTGLAEATYTPLLTKRLEGDVAVIEFALTYDGLGTRMLREIGLFGRDENNARVLLFRQVQGPIEMSAPLVARGRVEIRLEDI